jgi:hypothetical protein
LNINVSFLVNVYLVQTSFVELMFSTSLKDINFD